MDIILSNTAQLAIIGSLVACIVQGVAYLVKKKFGGNASVSIAILCAISIIGGAVYKVLENYGLLGNAVAILTVASAFHNIFIRRFESSTGK